MEEVQGTRTEGKVEEGDVADESTKDGFPEQTEVEPSISHTLSYQREFTSLAADQVSPLDDDDRDKESTLGVGESFVRVVAETGSWDVASLDSACLSVVLQMGERTADGSQVLHMETLGEPRKDGGVETVIVKNNKVGVEPGQGLEGTDLEVGEDNELGGDKTIGVHITRRLVHDVSFLVLVGEGDGGDHIGTKINTENEDSWQGKRNLDQDEQKKWRNFGNVGRKSVGDRFLQVIKDQTSLFDTLNE